MICKGGMPPLPAVLTLQDTRVHVSTADGSDITTNVETSVDKSFSSCTALRVPYIYPDNYHVGLRGNLNNARFGCNIDIVEDIC